MTDTTQAVKCTICGKLHDVTSQDYFKLDGNQYIGSDGDIMGGIQPGSTSYFCRGNFHIGNSDCLINFLRNHQVGAENSRTNFDIDLHRLSLTATDSYLSEVFRNE